MSLALTQLENVDVSLSFVSTNLVCNDELSSCFKLFNCYIDADYQLLCKVSPDYFYSEQWIDDICDVMLTNVGSQNSLIALNVCQVIFLSPPAFSCVLRCFV